METVINSDADMTEMPLELNLYLVIGVGLVFFCVIPVTDIGEHSEVSGNEGQ